MREFLLNQKTVDVQFKDSPLVEIRPMLRERQDPGPRLGFWARQWRRVCPRS